MAEICDLTGAIQFMTRVCDHFYRNVNKCEVTVLKAKSISLIQVKRKPGNNRADGLLVFRQKIIPCRLGRSGIHPIKREGDGLTPGGNFSVLYGYFRRDRITRPKTRLPLITINSKLGWCDDPASPNYNRPVKLPVSASHEKMLRKDRLYDVCLVLNYNIHPVIKRKGSAIFFHQTSYEGKPTAGCVAIDPEHMKKILPLISRNTVMRIIP